MPEASGAPLATTTGSWSDSVSISAKARYKRDCCRQFRGAGRSGRFKEAIYRAGIQEAWYAFRRECLSEEAAGWLQVKGIVYKEKKRPLKTISHFPNFPIATAQSSG